MPGDIKCLGISNDKRRVYSFYGLTKGKSTELRLFSSSNGWSFKSQIRKLSIVDNKSLDDVTGCDNFRLAHLKHHYYLSYTKPGARGNKFVTAISENLSKWKKIGETTKINEPGLIVSEFLFDHQYVAYFGEKDIRVAYSKDLVKWKIITTPVLKARKKRFDSHELIASNAFLNQEGIILVYYARDRKGMYSIGAALLDKDDPAKTLWRLEEPLWNQTEEMSDEKLTPLGIAEVDNKIVCYWMNSAGNVFSIFLPGIYYTPYQKRKTKKKSTATPALDRSEKNPIISPIRENSWESVATFNPTAFELDGKKYILYRAIGNDNISTVGCAITSDGVHVQKRFSAPIYVPREPFEGVHGVKFDPDKTPRYMSGGGWGGCEDARATVIDDRIYLLYAAYNGACEMDIAISSISTTDFRDQNWSSWTKPVLITNRDVKTKNPDATKEVMADRPGLTETGEKDASILPEKINGKYVIFHRIWPNIVIDYVDDLNFDGNTYLQGQDIIRVRPLMWDSFKIGLASAPLKIKEGWLMIYNAVDRRDMSKYKLGAMILDKDNPAKVLYRSAEPILEPIEPYEMRGPGNGIVFGCGALIYDNKLFVYYGGADHQSCVASADLDDFVKKMVKSQKPKLRKVTMN